MSIVFTNATLGNTGGGSARIGATSHIIQVVEAQHTGRIETSSTSPQSFFSGSITLQNASNSVAYYYNSAQRCDVGGGNWNLGYHRLIYTNNGSQLFFSSYNGFTHNNIIHFAKIGVHVPGSVGPHTYRIDVWAYPGSNVQFNSPGNQGNDGRAILRLMEISS
jgi:hypothetical protein